MSPSQTPGTVTVTGRANLSAAPDIANIRLGCQSVLPTVAEAVAASSAAVTAVRSALDGHGIGAADAPTGRVSITAQEQWENNKARITGYVAEQQLTVTIRSLDDVGQVLGDVVAAAGDAIRLYGVDFAIEDDTLLQASARDAAFAQAKSMAEQYAGLAGKALGAVIAIAEDAGRGPTPMPKARALAAVADAVPVEPGSVDANAAVTVTWELA